MSRLGDLSRRMNWPQKLRMLPVALVYLVVLVVWGLFPGILLYTVVVGWSWDDDLNWWAGLWLAISLLVNYGWGRLSGHWFIERLDRWLDRAVDWAMRPR